MYWLIKLLIIVYYLLFPINYWLINIPNKQNYYGCLILGISHYYLTKKKKKSINYTTQKYRQYSLSPSLKKCDLLHILRPLVELINLHCMQPYLSPSLKVFFIL